MVGKEEMRNTVEKRPVDSGSGSQPKDKSGHSGSPVFPMLETTMKQEQSLWRWGSKQWRFVFGAPGFCALSHHIVIYGRQYMYWAVTGGPQHVASMVFGGGRIDEKSTLGRAKLATFILTTVISSV
ncbi:hypothetical protein PoB_000570300 [Plakobranchus ocellatus]|uniref:Uncharacterized protein n=1 Tax=Plakobranchus ocellatus TaxID=259542 RepID=A0AAV3Y9R6_9GAST|nr:hypothetical protein PoB_000570300 [Plakobranchus ocellatus]